MPSPGCMLALTLIGEKQKKSLKPQEQHTGSVLVRAPRRPGPRGGFFFCPRTFREKFREIPDRSASTVSDWH